MAALALAAACVVPEAPPLDKDDLVGGKADTGDACLEIGAEPGCDVCAELGWYGDGECDGDLIDQGVCRGPDQDCDEPGCFEAHLDEAIALNEARSPRYEALTGGASVRVSGHLITSERLTKWIARGFDRRAMRWQQHGVGILCDEFVSMELAPEFRERAERAPAPLASYDKRSAFLLAAKLTAQLTFGGFEALSLALEDELAELEDTPEYHCMLRHTLESLLRASNLARVHARDAERLGLESPEALSRDLILTHIAALGLSTWLDNIAAPIQATGVPIICQDVPPIAPWP